MKIEDVIAKALMVAGQKLADETALMLTQHWFHETYQTHGNGD